MSYQFDIVHLNREVFSTCVSILLLKDLYFLQTKLGDFLEYIEQEERQNLQQVNLRKKYTVKFLGSYTSINLHISF